MANDTPPEKLRRRGVRLLDGDVPVTIGLSDIHRFGFVSRSTFHVSDDSLTQLLAVGLSQFAPMVAQAAYPAMAF